MGGFFLFLPTKAMNEKVSFSLAEPVSVWQTNAQILYPTEKSPTLVLPIFTCFFDRQPPLGIDKQLAFVSKKLKNW